MINTVHEVKLSLLIYNSMMQSVVEVLLTSLGLKSFGSLENRNQRWI